MVALNFKPEFADMIKRGRKFQTIRKRRKKNEIEAGNVLQFYTGLRTKNAQKFAVGQVVSVWPVTIGRQTLEVKRLAMNEARREAFAKADGFKSWDELVAWFDKQYGIPFEGVLIKFIVAPGEK